MSKLNADEVRTFGMVNRYGGDANYYLIMVSSGELYMKESEEGEFGAAQIRENAEIHVSYKQRVVIPKWRMLVSKWSITTGAGVSNQFHIMEM